MNYHILYSKKQYKTRSFSQTVKHSNEIVLGRVVSSEIFLGKFPEIYCNLSGYFRKFVKNVLFSLNTF